jgi:hypothetical protein
MTSRRQMKHIFAESVFVKYIQGDKRLTETANWCRNKEVMPFETVRLYDTQE